MTRRDRLWRVAGVVLIGSGCAAAAIDTGGSPLTLLFFLMAILGIVLASNGKRVAILWQAERRGHCDTVSVIHAQRVRRRDRKGEADRPGSST